MNYNLHFRSARWLLLGIPLLPLSVMSAVALGSPWPMLGWLIAIPLIIRLERNTSNDLWKELKRQHPKLFKNSKHIYGFIGDFFVHGSLSPTILEEAIHFTQSSNIDFDGVDSQSIGVSTEERISAWRVKSIQSVTYESNQTILSFVSAAGTSNIECDDQPTRDKVLKLLKESSTWSEDFVARKEFKLNIVCIVVFLVLSSYSGALIGTSLGLVQPKQLPLMDWNQAAKVRGKGRGIATVWVLLSELYLWLVQTLPPAGLFLLGTLFTAIFLVLLVITQWIKIKTVTLQNLRYGL